MPRYIDLKGRLLGAFLVREPKGLNEKQRQLWECEHLKKYGGCGAITIISSAVLLMRAPKFCAECRPANYRAHNPRGPY